MIVLNERVSKWLVVSTLFWILVQSWRLEPTNPFPPPILEQGNPALDAVFQSLEGKIQEAAKDESSPWITNLTSFSVVVTSAADALWTTSHTAPLLGNYSDGTPTPMSDQSYFRIASISKVFTVLAVLLQEKAGNCSLRDPITRYIPELEDHADDDTIDWNSITLETLASQLSGVPREYGMSDFTDPFAGRVLGFDDPSNIGLPPVHGDDVPPCGYNHVGSRPCTRKEIIDGITQRPPMFQPNYKATYGNMNFVLLGLALENMTGLAYPEIVQTTIFNPLGMKRATLTKPADTEGIIPNITNDWYADIGTYGPTGGIYTTPSDLALFARSILTNKLLDKATTNAWFHPHSSSSSYSFAYGMPFEIFRTNSLLPQASERIQTIVTKSGGLRGYTSQLLLIPEYDIALVVFVAGDGHLASWLREHILGALIPVVDRIARSQTSERLSGSYISSNITINSSLILEVQDRSRLVITSWISNSTDFLSRYISFSDPEHRGGKVQLLPSRISRGGKGNSEVWRTEFVRDDVPAEGEAVNMNLIVDVDGFTYASRSLHEFVFKLDGEDGHARKVNLPGFRITLDRQGGGGRKKSGGSGVGGKVYEGMKPLGLMD
ncbi:MAG: hypothetical protein Q9168_005888 [Polycauliona sp. 1 TL-2023]